MTLQSPEALLEHLNNALRHLRGACTVLDSDDIDSKLLAVMRRLLLAQVMGDTWVVAVGGSQGAGKTTLMASLYGLLDAEQKWLEGNEGRGEKMPVLILEQDGVKQVQGFVRRLVQNESAAGFTLQDVQVEEADFQKAISDPNAEDLLPVLRVPRRYFNRDNQAWLLLPGYERQDRENRAWQELMRQAMIAAGGCIVVTDETRMANQQQVEIVKDMLAGELAGVHPYVVVTKTEASQGDDAKRQQLRNTAQATFQVAPERAETHIILTGTDDPAYVKQWIEQFERALYNLNFTGQANRHLQISDLSELLGKDLTRVLGLISGKAQLYFNNDTSSEGARVLELVLSEFDDAAQALREEHLKQVNEVVGHALDRASKKLDEALKTDHEGFKNWVSNVFDTTSETRIKMKALVTSAWADGAAPLFTQYSRELEKLTAKRLGRDATAPTAGVAKPLLTAAPSRALKQVGYMHSSGEMVRFNALTPDATHDVRQLLSDPVQDSNVVSQPFSKALSKSVKLIPALSLEYTRLVYALPEVVGLKDGLVPADAVPAGNLVEDGVQSLGAGVELGKTAIKSLAAVMAVDVASDGKADILNTLLGNTQITSDDPGVTLPTVPLSPHPVAIAATAAVAAAYLTTVAVTRLRSFEKATSAQAHTMLHGVHDAHVEHLRVQFDQTMAVARARIVDSVRARYKMDEALMLKDRLACALTTVKSLAGDLRHDLDASATGLNVLAAGRDV
ncbi:sugar kinase [Pseudomonas sp. AS2.8]|uniref:sugar kinase n=1 Tax=Pseudomonas sp. AS2.8 TaxID=2587128 RepID=UPI001610B028|nr:sugar kinase [Pseudomonas sp. AS2.8]MBB2896668.1 energy-coupling factor transporter ATP-binding protein EcfA2 [Pseudomonas sp. AS2.8]